MKKVLGYLTNLWYTLIENRDDTSKRSGVIRMKAKYSALDIATWLIYKTNSEMKENQASNDSYEVYEGLTHLKLQKLLYYAQGISLSLTGEPLFSDKIQAWEHGPVVKLVFNTFNHKGRNEITIADAPKGVEIIRKIESDTSAREILNMTYDNFAIYTAWQLRNMTHKTDTPWYKTYFPGKNNVISLSLIKKYFDENIMQE